MVVGTVWFVRYGISRDFRYNRDWDVSSKCVLPRVEVGKILVSRIFLFHSSPNRRRGGGTSTSDGSMIDNRFGSIFYLFAPRSLGKN